MSLRYPLEIETGNDYMVFTHEPYRTNATGVTGQNFQDTDMSAGPPSAGEAIVMYMPNSTPAMSNQNSWGKATFAGPLGILKRDAGIGIARAAAEIGNGYTLETAKADWDKFMGQVKKEGGQAVRQLALGEIARMFGLNGAGALTQLQRGEVYNPNVELLYEAPQLRAFSFDFLFIPKSRAETVAMNNIIKEFKKWSSPFDNGTMLTVPHLWNVSYKSPMGEDLMGKFKKCALTGINIQHNPGTDMHVTFADGTPVVTAMQLAFQEVDIITRKDHDEGGPQGF